MPKYFFFYFLNALYVTFLSFHPENLPQLLQHITSCGVRILNTKRFFGIQPNEMQQNSMSDSLFVLMYIENIKKVIEISKNTDV